MCLSAIIIKHVACIRIRRRFVQISAWATASGTIGFKEAVSLLMAWHMSSHLKRPPKTQMNNLHCLIDHGFVPFCIGETSRNVALIFGMEDEVVNTKIDGMLMVSIIYRAVPYWPPKRSRDDPRQGNPSRRVSMGRPNGCPRFSKNTVSKCQ